MQVVHLVPSGLPTGRTSGLVDGDDWRDPHTVTHVPFEVAMFKANTATAPAAASAAANTEAFSTGKCCRVKTDLSTATQARLQAVVIANGNVAGASLKLSYSTSEASTWSGSDAGPVVVLGSTGGGTGIIHDSGWTNLAAGAIVDNCFLTCLVGTAFGTTAPTIGTLSVFFR